MGEVAESVKLTLAILLFIWIGIVIIVGGFFGFIIFGPIGGTLFIIFMVWFVWRLLKNGGAKNE